MSIVYFIDMLSLCCYDSLKRLHHKNFYQRRGNMVRERLTVTRKSFGFRLDVELVKELKIVAITESMPVNVLLEEGIRGMLKKYQKKGK